MNEKEIAEVRRRFRLDKNNITHIRGCYVNDQREIVSQFDQSMNLMPQEEKENILAVLRKTLAGTQGKNLIDISFKTQQVVDSDEHRLLMALKNSALKDEEAVGALFDRVIESLTLDGTYLILLTYDSYDIPFRGKDGAGLEDASSEVFSYVLCSVCPVKTTKPALSYYIPENTFQNCGVNWLVSSPELGFLFPAFDDRSANIYGVLYYYRDIAENHQELVDRIFQCEIPMPAAQQKETFESLLANTLADDCSLEVVQSVHNEFCGMIEEHKANKVPEPLVVSKKTVKRVLESCGVGEEHVEAFERRYDSEFGAETDLSPRNIVNPKQFQVSTPDVKIQVSPEHSDLIETRVIDGKKYILIRADEGVEVNGVSILL